MELVRFLLTRSHRTVVLAVFFGLLSGTLNSALLALINTGIARSNASRVELVIVFLILCMMAPLTRASAELLLVTLGQNSIFSLRVGLSRQAISMPLQQLEQLGTHRVLSVLTDDIPSITNMVSIIPVLCINTGVVLSCLAYMGWLNAKLLAAVLAFMVLGILTYHFGVTRGAMYFRNSRENDNKLQKHFQGLVHGFKELKLHRVRREAFLSEVLSNTADLSRRSNISALTIYTVASSWGQLLVFILVGAVIFFLAPAFHAGAGILTGFALALIYLMTPLQMIMNSLPGLARANVAIENVRELGLNMARNEAEGRNAETTAPAPIAFSGLELADVMYSYRHEDSQDEFALGPINLTISSGELLFISGGNGSGKTTLAKVLTGLYAPDTGTIFYNGAPIDDASRDNYRQSFSAVFSDFFLFETLLGLHGPELDERARAYLSSLRLDHKVKILQGALSTTELSQGQRKRLALLTACLEDRPIYFFDEWAADQDPAFKEVFYHSILPELKARGKTVIVISHDDRYYDVADRMVHLESGQIASARPAGTRGQEKEPIFRFQ